QVLNLGRGQRRRCRLALGRRLRKRGAAGEQQEHEARGGDFHKLWGFLIACRSNSTTARCSSPDIRLSASSAAPGEATSPAAPASSKSNSDASCPITANDASSSSGGSVLLTAATSSTAARRRCVVCGDGAA